MTTIWMMTFLYTTEGHMKNFSFHIHLRSLAHCLYRNHSEMITYWWILYMQNKMKWLRTSIETIKIGMVYFTFASIYTFNSMCINSTTNHLFVFLSNWRVLYYALFFLIRKARIRYLFGYYVDISSRAYNKYSYRL